VLLYLPNATELVSKLNLGLFTCLALGEGSDFVLPLGRHPVPATEIAVQRQLALAIPTISERLSPHFH